MKISVGGALIAAGFVALAAMPATATERSEYFAPGSNPRGAA